MLTKLSHLALVSMLLFPSPGSADALKSGEPTRRKRAWEEQYSDTDPIRARMSRPPSRAPRHPALEDIKSAIMAREDHGDLEIETSYRNGTVYLSGFVSSREAMSEIEQIASSAPEVERVESSLRLWPGLEDSAVEASLIGTLKDEPNLDLSRIRVSVEDGIARFDGLVSDHREIDRMLSVALMVRGVRGIESRVALADRARR